MVEVTTAKKPRKPGSGGRRAGSGRHRKEPSMVVRLPVRVAERVQAILQEVTVDELLRRLEIVASLVPPSLMAVPPMPAKAALMSVPPAPVTEPAPRRIELRGQRLAVMRPYEPQNPDFARIKDVRPSGTFNKPEQTWYFPLEAASSLIATYPHYAVDAAILPLVEAQKTAEVQRAAEAAEQQRIAVQQAAQATLVEQQQALDAAALILRLIDAARLDEALPSGRRLFEHQKDAVRWLLAHRRGGVLHGGILADHMGLGKSLSALVAAKAMYALYHCPILVVCPATLRANWLREAEIAGVAIEVFSWAKMPAPLEIQDYIVIADEAHFAQSLSSNRTQALLTLVNSPRCLAAWLLTGTPIKNGRPVNLYPLLVACQHPLAHNRRGYELRYCAARERNVGRGHRIWDVTGAAHMDELSAKTTDVILCRKKKDCLDLPPKLRTLRPAELSSEAQRTYNATLKALIQRYRDRVAAGEISDAAEALVTLNHLRQAGSIAKVESAVELASELLEQGQQVVLFTEFVESAQRLHEQLGGELLTGETKPEDRQGMVDRFQAGKSKVFVGTIKAGGVGITLTAANTVVLVDRPWTPGDAEQAEDRLHRIGQSDTVTAIWLQHSDIDTVIDRLLEAKQERIELVLKGKRKTLRGLSSPAELAKQLLEEFLQRA